jgi:predicted AlkP superfamily phosphohydrolase/phosphomutase
MMRPVRPLPLRMPFVVLAFLLASLFLLSLVFVPKPHVILIGWDGVSPELAGHLMSKGQLPNFNFLAERGTLNKLLTHNFTHTRLIWPIIYTGVGPDRNGIDVDIASRWEELQLTPEYRQVPALWEYVAYAGGWAMVITPYESYPAEKENHVLEISDIILDMPYISERPIDAYSSKKMMDYSIPRINWGLYNPWVENTLDFAISPVGFNKIFCEKYLDNLNTWDTKLSEKIKREVVATTTLAQQGGLLNCDLLLIYFVGTDLIQHEFNECYPMNSDALGKKHVDMTLRVYDAALGRIMDSSPPGSYFCVVSDHGFDMGPQPQVRFRVIDAGKKARLLAIKDEAVGASMGGKRFFDDIYVDGEDLIANINQKLTYDEQQSAINYLCEKPDIRPVGLGLDIDHGNSVNRELPLKYVGDAVPPVGICLMSGPDLKNMRRAKITSIYDVTPTLLYALDLDVAQDMDGKPNLCLFNPGYVSKHPIKLLSVMPARRKQKPATVLDNSWRLPELQGLGYTDSK